MCVCVCVCLYKVYHQWQVSYCCVTVRPVLFGHMIIMVCSCIAQIFPSRKLSALAHTIHANIRTAIIHKLYTHTHTHTCIAQIFPSRKLSALAHNHSRKHTHSNHTQNLHTHTHTHTHTHRVTRTHTLTVSYEKVVPRWRLAKPLTHTNCPCIVRLPYDGLNWHGPFSS